MGYIGGWSTPHLTTFLNIVPMGKCSKEPIYIWPFQNTRSQAGAKHSFIGVYMRLKINNCNKAF